MNLEAPAVTKRIQKQNSQKPNKGFISWFSQATFEQREINEFISVGRDTSQMIVLDDPFISRRHARIEKKKDHYVLKDMSSRNGIFLNGNKIFSAILKDQDRIQIGKTEFIFSAKRFQKNWKTFSHSLNPSWNKQLSRIPSMAQTDFPVLILGPSGSGKEHLAHMIHSQSLRNTGPYVSVNCSALTETLAESEFFGHVRGSYTGASHDRLGAFRSAHGGTLFLDEIGDLPLSLQPKLLRALESKEIKPVGSDQTIKVDVRIVTATHQNLQEKVLDKTFREDLYFRLHVLELNPPALKDRMEDFNNILNTLAVEFGVSFSTSAIDSLKSYHWPGNIRELRNSVARAKALFSNTILKADNVIEIIDPIYNKNTPSPEEKLPILKQMEKEILIKALKDHAGNQSIAAHHLNIPRTTFNRKLRSYGIDSNSCEN
ncbi:MAG: sigma 54-interacting transcriptional regulator [Bdellovibrionales bacterium]|nr:sigma 54-interacting transcriptional regulator [Bdellovibrionales bacterium]